MKKLKYTIYLVALFFSWGNASAQSISKENIPAVVLNSFQLKFPNAKDIYWKLIDGNYEVKCKVNDKVNIVIMDHRGQVLRYQQDLYISEIPESMLKIIRSKAPLFDVGDADKFVEGEKTRYEINFKIDGKHQYFWIDDKGHLVKYRKELHYEEIPASIMNFITTNFGRFDDIDRAKYVEENGKKIYIVAGEIKDSEHIFLFDDKVKLLEHQQDLKDSEIPAPIMNTVNQSFKGYNIKDADLKNNRGVMTYTLRIRKSDKTVYVTFNPKGEILNTK